MMTLILTTTSLFASSPAAAQAVSASQPETVVAALQDMGYRAQLGTDGVGDPKVSSMIDGVNYTIWFYGCTDNRDCQDLHFSAGFEMPDGVAMRLVNDWNGIKLVGRAHVDDDGNPWIKHFVTTTGGLPADNFERVIRRWGIAVSDFKTHIDF